jgi:hypothetical protein
MMRKPITTTVLLIVPLLLLGLAGVSQAQLVLYDDFNVKPINPAKWFGSEGQFGPGAPNTETTRKIANGQLKIDLTTWGRTDSDSGIAGISAARLRFSNPTPITTIQADVTVKSVKVVGCAFNNTPTRAFAVINGAYFNDGTSPGPGDVTGDIIGAILKVRDSLAGDRIEAIIWRCTNATCTILATLASGVFVTPWTKGVGDTLRLQWDPANDQFIYTVNPGANQEVITLAYTVSDTDPSLINMRQLADNNSPASCLSGPRTSATMKARFDNVMVNP